MEEIRGPDIKDLAEADYIRGMKYKEIAEKYNVSINTVKSWKTRNNWSRQENIKEIAKKTKEVKEKKVATKKVCTQKVAEVQPIEKSVCNLTDEQTLFCIYYVKYRNKTKAYQKAYNCSYANAHSNGYKLWQNKAIREEIERRLSGVRQEIAIDTKDIIQKYVDIAFADITDFLEIKREEVELKKGKKIIVNSVVLNDSTNIDGSLISEVKEGKEGISIKLHDKMKALEWLSDRLEILPVATREKLQIEKDKLKTMQDRNNFEMQKRESSGTGNLDQLTEAIRKSAEMYLGGGK